MREIRLIKQIHPETATPWGLHVSEGNRFEMLPGAYVTEKDARSARSDEQIRSAIRKTQDDINQKNRQKRSYHAY